LGDEVSVKKGVNMETRLTRKRGAHKKCLLGDEVSVQMVRTWQQEQPGSGVHTKGVWVMK